MEKTFQSDEDLWRNIVAGDDQSFAMFYDRYWLRMYKAAMHFLKDESASEEVVQEVFVTIWNKRETLDIKNFASYLNSATRYEVYRRLKAAKRAFVKYENNLVEAGMVYNAGDERLSELDGNNLLNECLKHLPKRCREVFYLSRMQQFSNQEISEQLGINKHTVENQLATALKYIRLNFSKIILLLIVLRTLTCLGVSVIRI